MIRSIWASRVALAAALFVAGCGVQSTNQNNSLPANSVNSGSIVAPPAGPRGFTPNTTLSAETGNNTSTADAFAEQSNGNLGAGNVSKVGTRTLLYPGAQTKIYAHFMGWFGESNHMDVRYRSDDPAQVERQASDALSRGISGFILDWYGPNNTMPNNTARVLMTEAESRGGAFIFAIMEDGGALGPCHNTPGCDLTNQMIIDLTYAYNNYQGSPAYMRIAGRPVVFFFDPDRYGALDWARVAANVPGNPLLIFQNGSGFTHDQSSGSISWVMINPDPNDWSQAYLDNFYQIARTYPSRHAYGATYKGFNDYLADWTLHRVVNQNCGQTWLSTFSEINHFYSSSTNLESLQLVTWNDYEEATEIESGIDNCVSVSASVSGTTLSWSISGSESTIDHYTIFVSQDGQQLMSLVDIPAGMRSLDMAPYGLPSGNYKVYVKAVGKPSIRNTMSNAPSINL